MTIERALVVDDDELSRELVQTMLERMGIQVLLAASGAEGLRVMETDTFDLLLVDLKLTDMNGLELVTRLRERPSGAHVRVMVISGAEATEGKARCRQAGCDSYLAKPFTFVQFQQALAALQTGLAQ